MRLDISSISPDVLVTLCKTTITDNGTYLITSQSEQHDESRNDFVKLNIKFARPFQSRLLLDGLCGHDVTC